MVGLARVSNMLQIQSASIRRSFMAILSVATLIVCSAGSAAAHPLGNFTINRFARIGVGSDFVEIRYVIDMAEIAAFQELQTLDSDGDRLPSAEELSAYAGRLSAQYADGILLTVEGVRIPLK